jgi:hypothetical protein
MSSGARTYLGNALHTLGFVMHNLGL